MTHARTIAKTKKSPPTRLFMYKHVARIHSRRECLCGSDPRCQGFLKEDDSKIHSPIYLFSTSSVSRRCRLVEKWVKWPLLRPCVGAFGVVSDKDEVIQLVQACCPSCITAAWHLICPLCLRAATALPKDRGLATNVVSGGLMRMSAVQRLPSSLLRASTFPRPAINTCFDLHLYQSQVFPLIGCPRSHVNDEYLDSRENLETEVYDFWQMSASHCQGKEREREKERERRRNIIPWIDVFDYLR